MVSALLVLVFLAILLAVLSLFPAADKWPLLSVAVILLGAALLVTHP